MDLDPRLLRYFLVLAEELNYGRAARRLHRSQSTITLAIRKLEEDFSVKLFDRDSRHVELTEAGRRLVPVARKVIEEIERAAEFLQGMARGEPEVFRIGYSPFVDFKIVGLIRAEFAAQDGGAPIALISSNTAAQIKAVLQGELQAGLLIAHDAPELVLESVAREPFLVAFRDGHRFAKLDRLSIGDIAAEPVVWFARDLNPRFHDEFLQTCADAGYAPKIVQEVGTILECLQFAREGVGITFATRSQQSMGIKGVGFRELADERFRFETALAYRADNRTEILERFIRFVKERFRHAP